MSDPVERYSASAPAVVRLPGPLRIFAAQALLFGLIVVSAHAAMRVITLPPTNLTVLWLPGGIALAAMIRGFGYAALPTVWLANWVVVALANDYALWAFRPYSYLLCLVNALTPALAYLHWRYLLAGNPFATGRSYLRFVFGVTLVPCLLTGWMVPAIIRLAGYLTDMDLLEFAIRSGITTLSGALGILLVVPLVVAPAAGVLKDRCGWRFGLHGLNALVSLGIAWLGFLVWGPGLYLALPLVLVASVVLGARGVAVMVAVITVFGLVATAHGWGPFVAPSTQPFGPLLEMGVFGFALSLPGQFAGITLEELRQHRRTLETQVAERTRDLKAAVERAEAADRAKSQFLAMVGHEIRTPMNGIVGFASVLETTGLDAHQRSYLEAIQENSESLLNLLNDLLDLSRIEAGKLEIRSEPFAPASLVDKAVALCRKAADDKALALDVDLGTTLPERLEGDAVRIRQVLINLLSNAIKFTEAGLVRVIARWEPAADGARSGRLQLIVKDTGMGIPAEAMPLLFRPFEQSDATIHGRFGGSGLGLAIARQICQSMHGDISVESREGEGSTFHADFRLKRLS